MKNSVDITQAPKSQSVANELATKAPKSETAAVFADNRPAAVFQRKLDELANQRPAMRQPFDASGHKSLAIHRRETPVLQAKGIIQRAKGSVQIEVGKSSKALAAEQQERQLDEDLGEGKDEQPLLGNSSSAENDSEEIGMELSDEFKISSPVLNPAKYKPLFGMPVPQVQQPALVINKVNIGGRPPGLLKGKEGSHTSAWVVYCDTVRSAIIDTTPDVAIQQIKLLYEDAKALPGMKNYALLGQDAKVLHDAAKAKFKNLKKIDPNTLLPQATIPYLQELTLAYLQFRNSIPLSQIDDGRATGHGEPFNVVTLRGANDYLTNHDALPNQQAINNVWTALWQMLDHKVILKLVDGTFNQTTAPGQGANLNSNDVAAKVIAQHIWTMQAAYKKVCASVEFDGEDSIKAFLGADFMGLDQMRITPLYQAIENVYNTGEDPKTGDNHPLLLPSAQEGKSNFSVQIINDGVNPVIKDVHIGGRPHGLLGSREGSHITAFIVLADEVRSCLINKSFKNAIGEIIRLLQKSFKLPGVEERLKLLDEWPKALYEQARQAAQKSVDEATAVVDNPILALPTLQNLVSSYLYFRNCLPLSQADGGVADGHAEAKKRARIRFINGDIKPNEWRANMYGPHPANDIEILDDLWGMLDYAVLRRIVAGDFEKADAPGIKGQKWDFLVLTDAISRHSISIESAYPIAYKKVPLYNRKHITYLLSKKMGFPDNEVKQIFSRSILTFLQ